MMNKEEIKVKNGWIEKINVVGILVLYVKYRYRRKINGSMNSNVLVFEYYFLWILGIVYSFN